MRLSPLGSWVLLIAGMMSGCSFPTAKDVMIHGRVLDGNGQPVVGLKIYVADLKYRSGMPGVGEHAYIYTDADGRYSVRFKRLHSALSISVLDFDRHAACPGATDVRNYAAIIDKSAYAGTHDVQKNLVYCLRTANNRWRGP